MTIFVQMVSYRDPECHHTLVDLFAKAANPEQISVGLCWQLDAEEDAEYLAVPYSRADQVKVVTFTAKEAKGAGWARTEAQKFYSGEDYILQIQAHMRFKQGWDETLIAMLESLPNKKAILTAWLPGYIPPDEKPDLNGQIPVAIINRLGPENDAQMLHLIKRMLPQEKLEKPFITALWVGNFMFTHAQTLIDVPFDPHVYFWGEELNYSARLWTHGYDIYHIHRVVLYHYWDRIGVKDASVYRDHGIEKNRLSLARNQHLLRLQYTQDEQALQNIEHYLLGSERSIADYWKFIGVNWGKKTIANFAREGFFASEDKTDSMLPKIFVSIAAYRDPEARHTVADLFAKAEYPERISVGLCLQYDEQEDADCMFATNYPQQVRIKQVNYKDSKGANWARAEAFSLRNGEEYVFAIDSHMRFEEGWDSSLIDMLARTPSNRAVISGYVPNYEPPDKLDHHDDRILRFCVRRIGRKNEAQLVHLTGRFVPIESAMAELYQSPFVAAGVIFAKADIFNEIPLDPHIHFYGDEITLSARLWTHGVDIYQPDAVVVYHYWARYDQLAKHDYRKNNPQAEQSRLRVRHLLEIEQTNDARALQNLDCYGLGNVRELEKFWQLSGVDVVNQTMSSQAITGAWNMRESPSDKPEIFVRIASYRDPELAATIDNLFATAAHPERIFVGLCCQYNENDAPSSFDIDERGGQVRIIYVPWEESAGVCWARAQTEILWAGEEYTLQIDSHMRFSQGWDEFLIAELAACPSAKPVLSCNPASYTPPNHLQSNPRPTIRVARAFTKEGNIRCRGVELETPAETPLSGAFIAAGFVFSHSDVLRQVPYDPYYYFNQEEIVYALRIYTHGWDVFSARSQCLYHFYNESGQSTRPMHWNDTRRLDEKKIRFLAARGLARMNHITGHQKAQDERTVVDLEKFSLGTVRSLADFEAYTGIDFAKKQVSNKALNGDFIIGAHPHKITENSLEIGDLMPHFELPNVGGKKHAIEKYVGKPTLLFFMSFAQLQNDKIFFQAFEEAIFTHSKLDCWIVFVVNASPEAVLEYQTKTKFSHRLWGDKNGEVARALAIASEGQGFLLDSKLQIKKLYQDMQSASTAIAMVNDAMSYQQAYQKKYSQRFIVEEVAPVLMVPNVFLADFCERLIAAFHAGDSYKGTVGASESESYKPSRKIRQDWVVTEPFLSEIDDKLRRALFPEIERIYGFMPSFRENYKVGLYRADEEGFFYAHRDNFEPSLGYRRIALTINLNDDYDGGELRFPEYGEHLYRPTQGGAIAFSCSMMHEVKKVTSGNRFMLVGFFHGETEEVYRRSYQQERGLPLDIERYALAADEPTNAVLSRDFYRKWLKK